MNDMARNGHDIVVMGASSGGVETLSAVVAGLPADLAAAVFIVIHIPARVRSRLPEILTRAGALKAVHPGDGERFERGRIYVAPPDAHMLLERERIRIVRGPRENNHRPAVDPLFRSAAVAHATRVVGVVLSGALDDGSAGVLAIRRRGGIVVVQDPAEALFPDMPRNAMIAVEPDHVLPRRDIATLLARLALEPASRDVPPLPDDLKHEMKAEVISMDAVENEDRPGKPSSFACPDCGGVLWEMDPQGAMRFRCRVGHAYGVEGLMSAQSTGVDDALWSAFRALEENASLTRRLAARARSNGHEDLARTYDRRAAAADQHCHAVQRLLLSDRNAEPSSETA